jgi:ABC-2 type transport system permease protein
MIERIRTIIDKEWAEVFKNKVVLLTVVLLPVIFTVLPLVILSLMRTTMPGSESTDMPAQFTQMCSATASGSDCVQIFIANEFLIFFMIMPIIIPITIAAYSIVGEKTTRSLEPLLATPITTEELLAGKSLAAAIPAVVATYACFIIFILLLPVTGVSAAVQRYVSGPIWILAVFLAGPLVAILAVNFAIMVSSRVSDPRTAEQISAILIVPFMALVFGQMAGVILLNVATMLIFCAIIVFLDIVSIVLGAKLFQRETILTKWK